MREIRRDEEAERAITSAVLHLIEKSAVDEVRVSSAEDQEGEQALFVAVRLKSKQARPSGAVSIDLLKAMRDALQAIDDDRFPYLSFIAPGDEPAEDTRKIA
jgi:hypothetical protein